VTGTTATPPGTPKSRRNLASHNSVNRPRRRFGFGFKLVGGEHGAGDLLPEHLFAAGRLQLGELASEILGVGRDAGIAVNHARILHQKFASKKSNRISALVLMQIS
jgi:hypothetical protein